MTTIRVKAPAALTWGVVLFVGVAVVAGMLAPPWAAVAVILIGAAAISVAGFRFGQKVRPLADEAREADGRNPHIELTYPKWYKLADYKFSGLFIAGTLLVLCALLIVATVLLALGYE